MFFYIPSSLWLEDLEILLKMKDFLMNKIDHKFISSSKNI